MAFTQNAGQWDEQVLFRADAHGAVMWFTTDGVYYQFTRRVPDLDKTAVGASGHSPVFNDRIDPDKDSLETMMIKASFVGANPNPNMRGEDLMEYKCNYFLGNDPAKWRTDVPNYEAVVFEDIYAGIDLKYYGDGRKMEYDFIISPGADPSQIAVRYEGAKSVSVNAASELVVETDWNRVVEQCPVVYQVDGDTRCAISGAYTLRGDNTFGFILDETYDPTLALVIDPTLVYSTYLGGGSVDCGYSIAVDATGAAYVTGYTHSLLFPTLNAYDSIYGGAANADVFVTKISSTGNYLEYSTFLGGIDEDAGAGITVDVSGAAYVTGATVSTDFPVFNAYDSTFNGVRDIFVAKISNTGSSLIYSTYLGGEDYDQGKDIAIDASGAAYVTGETNSANFPTTLSAYQTYQGNRDAFIFKLGSAGSLVYSTCLGGSAWSEEGNGISVDATGAVYVTGQTYSNNFPTLNAYDSTYGGGWDAFITKLNVSGNSLVFSTFLGGTSNEIAYDIAIDAAGAAYVTGGTSSSDFPTYSAYDATYNDGGGDAFIAKIGSTGNSLVYSTYLGGSGGEDQGTGIAVDAAGAAYVAGQTYSLDIPCFRACDSTYNGDMDGFVAEIKSSGDDLVYSTYLGGEDYDRAHSIAIDAAGAAYVTGWTSSTSFPTRNAYESTYGGGGADAIVTKIWNRLVVYALDDSGAGSLRELLTMANSLNGKDTIIFAVSGTIALASPLPALVDDSTVILGSTAPGGNWSIVLDGFAISGGGDGLVVQSRDNVIEGLAISNFPGNGISVTGALSIRNTLTRNLIYENNGLAIDLGADGVTANDAGDIDTGPNDLCNYPVVDTLYDGLNGNFYLNGRADDSMVVEFYVAHPAGQDDKPGDPSGHGEAYTYVGSDTCDSDGYFDYTVSSSFGNYSKVSMIAINTLGNTSEFSENYTLIPAPLIVVAYSPVNIIITDPDDLQFGKDSLDNAITGIPDGHYFVTPNDSVVIDHPKLGEYIIQFVTEAGTPPGAMYSAIIKIDGTDQVAIAADEYAPISGTLATFTYDVEEGYHYINADANRDSTIDVGDAVFIINYVFKGGPAPYPVEAADANCDHLINVGDAVHIINYIFKGGPAPCFFEE